MKKITVGILAVSVLAVGLVGFIFAKNRGAGRFGGEGFPPPFVVEKIARELGLSEEQKSNAKTILEESKSRVKPLMEKMKEDRETAKNLGTDGHFDEAKVGELARQQGETMKQLIVEKEKTKAQLFAILTPEQREKAKLMYERFGARMKGKFGLRFGEKSVPEKESF